MKKFKFMTLLLCIGIVFSGCNMNNTVKGTGIGAAGGAVLGGIIGKIAGNTAVGAAIGGVVGGATGALIGKHMDKVKQEAEAVKNAKVESVTDANGLQAVKVTFDSGILFQTGSSTLSSVAQTSLNQFANDVLLKNSNLDVAIQGYTDNQGWKNSTAEASTQKNLNLSQERANSVTNYLLGKGVGTSQIKSSTGFGEQNPVSDNSTTAGQKQNRRVEVYLYASEEMINQANSGTLQ